MIDMQFVPVSRLTKHSDRFHCGPYRAVISARVCVLRQQALRGWRNSEKLMVFDMQCQKCPVGASVYERVGAVDERTIHMANVPSHAMRPNRNRRVER